MLEVGPFSSKRWYFGKMVKWSYSAKCVSNWQNSQKWQSLRLERWSGLNVLNFDRCQPQEKPLTARIQMKLNPQYVSFFQPYDVSAGRSWLKLFWSRNDSAYIEFRGRQTQNSRWYVFSIKNGSLESVYDVRNTPRCYCVIEKVHAKEFLWILRSFDEL